MVTVVVGALARMVSSIDLTTDEEVDPDLATAWFDDVADRFARLDPDDRAALAALFRRAAAEEPRAELREAMLSIPEDFGLVDGDE